MKCERTVYTRTKVADPNEQSERKRGKRRISHDRSWVRSTRDHILELWNETPEVTSASKTQSSLLECCRKHIRLD